MPGISGVFLHKNIGNNLLDIMINSMLNKVSLTDDYIVDKLSNANVVLGKKCKGAINRTKIETYEERYTLLLDGYINNLYELLEESFRVATGSRSLLSVIGALYDKYGVSLFEKLNGVFLLAIHDHMNNSVIVCPDRLGYKKLYYFTDSVKTVFSSDYDAVVDQISGARSINKDAIWDIVNYNAIIGTSTILKNISLIKDGCYLYIDDENVKEIRYWSFPNRIEWRQDSEKEIVEETIEVIKHCFNRAIKQCADKKDIFIPLSGGLDSRLCVGLLSEKERNIKCLHVGTPMWEETRISRQIAEALGIDWELFDFKDYDFWELEKDWDLYNNGNATMMYFFRFYPMFKYSSMIPGLSIAVDGIGLDILLRGIFLLVDFNMSNRKDFYDAIRRQFTFADYEITDMIFSKEVATNIKKRSIEAVEEVLNQSEAANSIEATREFYFKVRSRKLVSSGNAFWEASQEFLFPGVDNELFDHCVTLSPKHFKGGPVYRKCLSSLLPQIAQIPWEKTGKPILRNVSRYEMRYKAFTNKLTRKLCRISKGMVDLSTNSVSYDRFYRQNDSFRKWADSIIFNKNSKMKEIYNIDGLHKVTKLQLKGTNLFRFINTAISIEKLFSKYS